jgi:hypothetical protein
LTAVDGDSCRLSIDKSGLPPTVTCEGCHVTDYCSEDCQKLPFPLHAEICSYNAAAYHRLLDDMSRPISTADGSAESVDELASAGSR